MKESTKKKWKVFSAKLAKAAKNAGKNVDRMNRQVMSGSLTHSKNLSAGKKPTVKKKPVVKSPRPKTTGSSRGGGQSGQVIVNVNVGGSHVQTSPSAPWAVKPKTGKKPSVKKKPTAKKVKKSSSLIDDALYGYNL